MEQEKAVDLAVKNIIKEGLTDIFDRPFEVDMLAKNKIFQKKVVDSTLKCLRSGSVSELKVNPIDYILIPKNSAFNFRKCALIQPHDTIKYLSLVLLIADEIEKARIPITRKRVFSYRLHPNKGYLFNRHYTITLFKKMVKEKSKRKKIKVIVSTDIANYYERLNLHRLQNTLLSIGCDRKIVNLINELLLFWSNRDSYGLPVGSNASRILSEANLIGIDNYLLSMNVDFIRFVDDYRLFAPDASTAHYWLTLLIERLGQEGLSINMGKTSVESTEIFNKKLSDTMGKRTTRKTDINSGERKGNPFIIKAGYGGTVPSRYRKFSNSEKEKLLSLNTSELLSNAESNNIVEAKDFTEIIKACIAQEKYSDLIKILSVIDKFLQLTPYYIDALIKNSSFLSTADIDKIKEYFSERLQNTTFLPEYLALAYIRLFGHNPFADKTILINYFRNLRRDSGSYVGRAILDSLYGLSLREDVLEIRKNFSRSDLWEKRQIIRIIDKILESEEKRPWLKNIRQTESNEIFLLEVIYPSKIINKKRKK